MGQKLTFIFTAVFLSLGIASAGHFISQGIQSLADSRRLIDVRGLDEQLVKSTDGYLDLRCVSSHDDPKVVARTLKTQIATIQSHLKSAGFTNQELAVVPINLVENNFSQPDPQQRPPRYTGRSGVLVTSRRVDAVYEASKGVSELIDLGVMLESSGARFLFTELNQLKPAMLKRATQNARESAQTFAQDAGISLGKLHAASQGVFSITGPHTDYEDDSSVMKRVRVVVKASYQTN